MDPSPVREHVKLLLGSGMSQSFLAKVSGVSISSINRMVYPHMFSNRVLPRIANALLSVEPLPSPTTLVDATPSRRRIQALGCMGWPHEALRDKSGVSFSVIQALCSGRRKQVQRYTHEKLAAVYEEICMLDGCNARAKQYAIRKRWIPPLGWDDIDDLNEKPNWGSTVHNSIKGRKKK